MYFFSINCFRYKFFGLSLAIPSVSLWHHRYFLADKKRAAWANIPSFSQWISPIFLVLNSNFPKIAQTNKPGSTFIGGLLYTLSYAFFNPIYKSKYPLKVLITISINQSLSNPSLRQSVCPPTTDHIQTVYLPTRTVIDRRKN